MTHVSITQLLFAKGEPEAPLFDEVQFTLDDQPVAVGDTVTIYTGQWYNWRQGRIETICDNPYYGQSGMVAYVVSFEGEPFWTEYVSVEVQTS